jgi:tRNA pseudouridine38-40 synthase
MAERNIKLIIAYDGSSYHGWQRQPNADTIQQQIEFALERLCGKHIDITGASRTDAGVSALGQTANFTIDSPIPVGNFAKALTQYLPDEIAVVSAEHVSDNFNSISNAKNKYYRYTICTDQTPPVLNIKHCWHYPYALDVENMNIAAKLLIGKKDFKSFASAADTRTTSVRTVTRCEVTSNNYWIYIDIEGDGFLYNMVRNVTGTLVEIGRGRWTPEHILDILTAKDRSVAGPLAPAAGLCLMRIDY